MKIGLRIHAELARLVSLQRVARSTYEVLSTRGEVVLLPPEYPFVPAEEQRRLAEEFLRECDVVVGALDGGLLAARRRLGSRTPFVFFTYGDLSVGGWAMRTHLANLTTSDVMLVNCASEVEIANRLFRNACVRIIPFALDTRAFYPLDEEERRAARQRLRFRESDRIILYAGRIKLEKGVHQLLSIFNVICERVPDAHLVLAGDVGGESMLELFGVAPVWLPNTFSKLISRVERPERVRAISAPDDQRLRDLYNIADVKVNLTLNPDENFGLAQVEAMACGTPVVGTAWGGLKDTIVDGVTGYKVSTVPTATGVKLSWWEALNRIVALLEDGPALRALRDECPRAAERYTPAAFGGVMEEVLATGARNRERTAEPLQATRFAEEFWSVCDPRLPGAAYRRGPRAEELHRALVTPFTAVSPEHAPAWEALEPDQVLSLATPVHVDGNGKYRPDDVFYAFEVEAPAAHREAVDAILALMRDRPAILLGELTRALPAQGVPAALTWMLDAGLVLRTRPRPEWMEPGTVDRRLAEVALSVQPVDRSATDLIVYPR